MGNSKPARGGVSPEDPSAVAVRAVRAHMELDEIEAARGVYDQARRKIKGWHPPPTEWLDLVGGLIKAEAWDDAIRVLESYVDELEAPSARARLKLAQLVLQRQTRPARALRMLNEIRTDELPTSLGPIRAQLIRLAEKAVEEGPLELEDEV